MKSKKKKIKKILISFLLVCSISCFTLFYFSYNGMKDIIKVKYIELNNEVYLSDILEDTVELLSENKLLDTNTLSILSDTFSFKSIFKVNKKYQIKVVDTTPPKIEGVEDIELVVGNKIDLYKNVKITDNSNYFTTSIVGEYDFETPGNYSLKYYAKDNQNNETTKEFNLNIITNSLNYNFNTTKGYIGKVRNGVTTINNIVIVNKTYSIPSNYTNSMNGECENAYKEMKKAYQLLEYNASYRSYDTQKSIYNSYLSKYGLTEANRIAAKPGYSEHQAGLAYDFNTINSSWLNKNAYKYGFILRYPNGKENITGYKYEDWHYRYVGKDLANILYNNGKWITLEEYFGIESKYK